MDDSHVDDSLVFNAKGELVPKGAPTGFGKVHLCHRHARAHIHTGQDGSKCEVCRLRERVKELEAMGTRESARLSELYLASSAENQRLRSAAETSIRKCEQYWNEHNIPDAEVHVALELIHRELRQAVEVSDETE